MNKRKSEDQWMMLIKDFKASDLNLTAWCRKKEFAKIPFTHKGIFCFLSNGIKKIS